MLISPRLFLSHLHDKKALVAETLRELTKAALRLSARERVWLAESLLLSIDEESEAMIDEATLAEFERRVQELKAGHVAGIPVEAVWREIETALASKA